MAEPAVTERPQFRFPGCPCVDCCEGEHVGGCRDCAGKGDDDNGICETCQGSGVCEVCNGMNEQIVTAAELLKHLNEAEAKAWDSLGKYKFQMFGYWAAIWVHLNRIGGFKRPNPWKALVKSAREAARG